MAVGAKQARGGSRNEGRGCHTATCPFPASPPPYDALSLHVFAWTSLLALSFACPPQPRSHPQRPPARAVPPLRHGTLRRRGRRARPLGARRLRLASRPGVYSHALARCGACAKRRAARVRGGTGLGGRHGPAQSRAAREAGEEEGRHGITKTETRATDYNVADRLREGSGRGGDRDVEWECHAEWAARRG